MSKPRDDWWPYVKGMIRRYPVLKEQYADLHSTSLAADYSGMPKGSSPSRATESIAIRELPSNHQREYEAVRQAIAVTERMRNGRDRLCIVRLVLWDKSYTLSGAALNVPVPYDTAQNWQCDFIKLVAWKYGLMD